MDLLRKISQERERRVESLHLDLPIPTWDEQLVARFEVLPRKEFEKFAKGKASPDNDANFVIRSCAALYLHDPEHLAEGQRMEENDDYVRIEDETGMPVGFDAMLAEKLGIKAERAIDVLMYCFKDNVLSVSALGQKVVRWMQNTDTQIAEAISGE